MSLQKIAAHLRSISPEEAQAIMNKNPSYVFFDVTKERTLSFQGTELEPGRTIASDQKFFPKGALAYLEYERPLFHDAAAGDVSEWQPGSRFVLDQDTGGAIRGPHRLDLYWGKGKEAGRVAGVMNRWGRLHYLVPKAELLDRLRTILP